MTEQIDQATQVGRDAQPVQAAQAVQSGRVAQAAQPGRDAQPVQAAQAGRVAQAAQAAQDAQPGRVAQAAQAAQMESIAFAGSVLAPFFLNDPGRGTAAASFAAMVELNVDGAAAEWPFADAAEAVASLGLMQQGLAAGVDDEALVWEYRRLFVGPGHLPAPPWGSVYTDHECVVFGESTLELRAWMRRRGVERIADERTPEDHIGLMLALLAFLADERPELVDEYLRDHLLTWAPHYLDILEDAATHPFYEGLARLTRATLSGMGEARGLSVTPPRFYR